MTKVIVIGEIPAPEKKLVPIKLLKVLNWRSFCNDTEAKTSNFKNVELITRKYTADGFDLIFCYNDDRNDNNSCALFIGQWNDGVI